MEKKMKPLSIIYWTRALLGAVAALITALLSGLSPTFNILNGISIALIIYIITYYVYKARFRAHVEKTSKIFSTGIGAYFISWLVMWVLFYTLLY